MRYLHFKWPFDCVTEEQIKQMQTIFKQNNIKYVFCRSTGYWPHEWIVDRSGKTYNNIMSLVNAIYSPRYDYVNNGSTMIYDEETKTYCMQSANTYLYS